MPSGLNHNDTTSPLTQTTEMDRPSTYLARPAGNVGASTHRTRIRSGAAFAVMVSSMDLHPAVADRLARLAPDQRAAATAPPGPVLCVAPAGSGKTTTLVARIAWLVDTGVEPATVAAITFNKRAAEELRERVAAALEPMGADLADRVRIRTFHALGME